MRSRTALTAYRVFFAVLTLSAVLVQYVNVSARPAFRAVNFFSFFTIESNIFAALVFLATVLLWSRGDNSPARDMARGAATLYMVTTGIIYVLLLSGLEESLQTPIPWVNLVLHYVMPIATALDWLIDPPRHPIPFRRALVWLVFPVLYLIYSLVRGPIANWYPYPFLNPTGAGGYGRIALTVVGISIALSVFMALILWVTHRARRWTGVSRTWPTGGIAWGVVLIGAGAVAAAPLSLSSRVGWIGVGPIIFGTTPAQAAATGTKFGSTKPMRGSSCYYLRPVALKGLSFMVEHGTIRRAEVVIASMNTIDGFRVGDPSAKVESFYGGRARLGQDKYDPEAQTITVMPEDGTDAKYRMVFKVKSGTVREIVSGTLPQVEYVEGCS